MPLSLAFMRAQQAFFPLIQILCHCTVYKKVTHTGRTEQPALNSPLHCKGVSVCERDGVWNYEGVFFFSFQATEHTACTAFGFVVVIWRQGDVKLSEVKPKMSHLRIESLNNPQQHETGSSLMLNNLSSCLYSGTEWVHRPSLNSVPEPTGKGPTHLCFVGFVLGFVNIEHWFFFVCFFALPGPSSWRWRLEKWQKKKRGALERWAGAQHTYDGCTEMLQVRLGC